MKLNNLTNFDNFKNIISQTTVHIRKINWIKIFNRKISTENIIINFNDTSEDPIFCNLIHFIINENNEFLIVVQLYNTFVYDT